MMASIGRFVASAFSGSAEATVALANFNIDFTLCKVEAPKEFANVGSELSPSRRREAEEGSPHVLARKLGSLFKGILPNTPELIKAYGSRASEIARSNIANPRGDKSYGVFASRIGADATTLWAAATSGRAAIACHLLACILARMWEGPEATSIWVEITSRRKQELLNSLEASESDDFSLMVAARQTILRSDLADWDASARAWLRVADSVKAVQQTQLHLVIDNINLAVNSKTDTYESVMHAWKASLLQMEQLLQGIPQQAQSGEILLSLSAWHLYPDMVVLESTAKDIPQNDPLFTSRGVLTLGLNTPHGEGEGGVCWSLPLAHLRHYGLPVTRSRTIKSIQNGRITVDELLWAVAAAYMRPWDDGSVTMESAIQSFANTASWLHEGFADNHPECVGNLVSPENTSWLAQFSLQSTKYLSSIGQTRKVRNQLWNLGRKYCEIFAFTQPFNDIFSASTFLAFAYSLEDKIALLREIANTDKSCDSTTWIIRYRHRDPETNVTEYEYATTHAGNWSSKRDFDGVVKQSHQRWISYGRKNHDPPVDKDILDDEMSLETLLNKDSYIEDSWLTERITDDLEEKLPEHSPSRGTEYKDQLVHETLQKYYHTRIEQIQSMGELVEHAESMFGHVKDAQFSRYRLSKPSGESVLDQSSRYLPVLGDPGTIALFRLVDNEVIAQEEDVNRLMADYRSSTRINTAIRMRYFTPEKLSFSRCAEFLDLGAINNAANQNALCSLRAISSMANLYANMDGATVDVKAVRLNYGTLQWYLPARARERNVGGMYFRSLKPYIMHHAASFACIAAMETGSFDLEPSQLRFVMALSSADSLYIASALLHDPSEYSRRTGIQRVTGNIGRAGVVFLVPPLEPMMKSYGIDEWHLMNHTSFDGSLDDSFSSTSLQLSFTDATLPINVGFSGGRDVEAYFLETLISVYDRGDWVADLDVLKAFEGESISWVACEDPKGDMQLSCTSVDSFAEMICPPDCVGIIRSRGNWQAKLAAVAICGARDFSVVIMSENICWGCMGIQVDKMRSIRHSRPLMIVL